MPPFLMELIYMIGTIAVLGVLLWGLMQLPIDDMFKGIIRVIIIVVLCIVVIYFLISMVGGFYPGMAIPTYHRPY